VSIVAAPCRRLIQAARWNGQAPQVATGAASVRAALCQLSNCNAGIIETSSTGSVRTAASTSRCRSAEAASGSAAASAAGPSAGPAAGSIGGGGSAAV
jgi:hypothetical protein